MSNASESTAPEAGTGSGSEDVNVLDQRWARRNPSRIGAQIQHPSLASPILCTIKDTSSTGARLELSVVRGGQISRDRAPDRFTLFMQAERLLVDCEVAWRKGTLLGVRYVSPTRRAPKQQLKPLEMPKKPGMSILAKIINPL